MTDTTHYYDRKLGKVFYMALKPQVDEIHDTYSKLEIDVIANNGHMETVRLAEESGIPYGTVCLMRNCFRKRP